MHYRQQSAGQNDVHDVECVSSAQVQRELHVRVPESKHKDLRITGLEVSHTLWPAHPGVEPLSPHPRKTETLVILSLRVGSRPRPRSRSPVQILDPPERLVRWYNMRVGPGCCEQSCSHNRNKWHELVLLCLAFFSQTLQQTNRTKPGVGTAGQNCFQPFSLGVIDVPLSVQLEVVGDHFTG